MDNPIPPVVPQEQQASSQPSVPVNPQTTQVNAFPKSRVNKFAIITIFAVLLLAGGGMFGYFVSQSMFPKVNVIQNQSLPIANNTNNLNNNTPTTTVSPVAINPTPGPQTNDTGSCKNSGPVLGSASGMVQWQNAADVAGLNIFTDGSSNASIYQNDNSVIVGHFIGGKYQGGDLLITQLSLQYYDEMGGNSSQLYHIVRQGNLYTVLDKYSPNLPSPTDAKAKVSLSEDKDFDLIDLDIPSTLHSSNPAADFNIIAGITAFPFCADGLIQAFTDPVLGVVYTDQTDITPKGPLGYGFYIKIPDGTMRIYRMDISIVGKDNVPLVTWSGGTKNAAEYTYTDRTGCGSYNYASVEPADKVNFDGDLVQSGTIATNGQPVYEFKNTDNPILKDIYDNQNNTYNGEKKIPYKQFITQHPIFFWKDPFGRLVKFQNSTFMPMAECGKPVIYLYPETTEKISVKLSPVGGFTYSEPDYNNGWNVIADPLSNITNLADGKIYPYLFWEGRGGLYQTPSKGFIVEQKDVHQFLTDNLHKLGLNDKESADFMEFWEPKMQSSPYYFVTFMGNSVMDELAPLSISPKPDTVIRILMDFTPLNAPISAEGYNIRTPQRKGFTVVEWGGVLR